MSLCIGMAPFDVYGRFSVHKLWIFQYPVAGNCLESAHACMPALVIGLFMSVQMRAILCL